MPMAAGPPVGGRGGRCCVGAKSRRCAGAVRESSARGQVTSGTSTRSSAKIRCASARMWAASCVVRERRHEVEVGGDAADADVVAEERADALLEDRAPPLGDVLEEACSSGKPRVTTLPSTPIGRQTAISGLTARLRSVIVVDDRGPAAGGGARGRRPAASPAAPAAPASGARAGAGGRGRPAPAVGWRRPGAGGRRPAARPRRSAGRGAAPASGGGARPAARCGGSRPAAGGAGDGRRGRAAARCRTRARSPARRRATAGSSRASSSWRRRPPGPRRVGSMAARRRAAAARAGSAGAAGREPGEQPLAQRVDDLVQEDAQVPAALLEPVEEADARRPRRPPASAIDEAVDQLGVGEAQQVPHGVGLDAARPSTTSSWSRIDSASRMPPAARRAMSATASGSASRPSAARIRSSLPRDLGDGEPPDVEPLEPRQDRRREVLRVGRREHEGHEVGRLLERLEEGVPGVLRDLVGLVEDVDLAPQVRRARS